MPTPYTNRRAAERWFLDNGLPSFVTRRARWRGLWPRSAPALTGFAALTVVGLAIYLLVGDIHVDIDGEPTPGEWTVLAVLVLTVPFVIINGWLVSRLRSGGTGKRRGHPPSGMGLRGADAHQPASGGHHNRGRPRHPGRPREQLLA